MLWREALLAQLNIGAPVQVTHLRGRSSPLYGFGLHSTDFTEVKVSKLLNVLMFIFSLGYVSYWAFNRLFLA